METFKYFILGLPWGAFIFSVLLPLVLDARLEESSRRQTFLVWKILGILLGAAAITFAFSVSLVSPQGIGFSAGTILGLVATKNLNARGK